MALDSVPFALGPTYGAYLWSAILCTSFWAITCVQVFIYFMRSSKDSKLIKYMILSVWALDTIHEAMIVGSVHVYLVTNFGDFQSFMTVIPTMLLEFLFQVIASTITQGFFVWRIFQLSTHYSLWSKVKSMRWLAFAIWVPFGCLQIGLCVLYIVKGLQSPTVLTLVSPFFYNQTIVYLVIASAVDLALSLTITVILYQLRHSELSQYSSTSSALKKLIIISINNGIWTALFAILDLILYVAYPTTTLYLIFDFTMCSLYTNTLLANLNARDYVASCLATEVMMSNNMPASSSLEFPNPLESSMRFDDRSKAKDRK
ncbi:hypothetical protein DFJ43DRAFT_1045732 [Lentinula guzmanii]|uniref:DUF6534 domain-containing protein n=1 Tax=Lentinula guzmanii TaxID=2804957 RepID=A0AA38N507_9AGAR|nr:hypothetical protein DFJ43DRAFT_1045732 [Lentinula guzmanii]